MLQFAGFVETRPISFLTLCCTSEGGKKVDEKNPEERGEKRRRDLVWEVATNAVDCESPHPL